MSKYGIFPQKCNQQNYKEKNVHKRVHPKLDLVNMVVRPFLFTKSSLDKKYNKKKGAGVHSLNQVYH